MKKVLIVCHDNLLYGASKSLLDWIKTIDKNKEQYEFLFLIPNTSGPLKSELEKIGQKVVQLRYYQPIRKFNSNTLEIKIKNIIRAMLCYIFNPIAISKMKKVCLREEIDLIHSNSFVISIGAEIALKTGLPHVWHVREFMEEDHMMSYIYSDSYIKKLTKRSYPIYISKAIKRKFEDFFPANKGTIIYNTISRDKDYKKNRTYMQDGICNLIIVGKITKNKGQLEAIQAVEEVIRRGYNAKLYVCGEGPDEVVIKKYINEHSLQENIKLLGFRKDVVNIRTNMDIALMCSSNEAFGRVTVEGMYYHNLVIGKKSAGTEEIIKNGENGLLYEPNDSITLADLIINMIENQTDAKIMIVEAEKYAISTFSKSIFPLVKEIYDSAIGEKNDSQFI